MPVLLSTSDAEFEPDFHAFQNRKRSAAARVREDVDEIIDRVRNGGDKALSELTRRLDGFQLGACALPWPEERIELEIGKVSRTEREALESAASRILDYHRRQIPSDECWTDASGARLGWRWTPADAVGLYVPGGIAAYPSSVLMSAIPAKVAGVRKLLVASPAPGGKANPLVFLAARLAGVDSIFPVGGAQAIAAFACGTETVPQVDMIAGPGNAYVAEAKRLLFGQVGIDMLAGPSEILVIADKDNDPEWVALDLLSQAEHDRAAQAILISTDREFAECVERAVARRLETLPRRKIARRSWEEFGAVILVRNLGEAADLCNRLAPEHVQLCVAEPEELSADIRHAGAIFLGRWTPEAIGDYVAGPSHVLPTSGSARFSSGLSVADFMKRTSITGFSANSLAETGESAETLARAEGLEAHALSIRARLDAIGDGRA
ncbi:MAG: histidinol dehydrogenase [Albidovulum sp.]|nr:histidinol dehydrogenase [Albidovulum sp.]